MAVDPTLWEVEGEGLLRARREVAPGQQLLRGF